MSVTFIVYSKINNSTLEAYSKKKKNLAVQEYLKNGSSRKMYFDWLIDDPPNIIMKNENEKY